MLSALIPALAMSGQALADRNPGSEIVQVGWHDEFQSIARWHPLDIENKAIASLPEPGDLRLSLNHVPNTWPYAYQWSGVTRSFRADIRRYPVLMAYVTHVHGYAHLDIDVLDAKGKAVKTIRSTTATGPNPRMSVAGMRPQGFQGGDIDSAVVVADLGKELPPGAYSLKLRLIVGGENSGCSAEYHWLRFTSRKDENRLAAYPETKFHS